VADFGIARSQRAASSVGLTTTGVAIGTTAYMSPEQALGKGGDDPRTDLYALGCTAFEVLTGERPFAASNAMESLSRKLTEAPPAMSPCPPGVGPEVVAAVRKAMAREAAERFESMQAFAEALGGDPSPTAARKASRRGMHIALAAAGWMALRPRSDAEAEVVATASRPLVSTMAVLPFENLSCEADVNYIVEGLADELVTSLSQVPGLRVASRTATVALRNRGLELEEIAAKLDVETVLEGSIRVSADQVRVSARLVKVSNGYSIWSRSYDRSFTEVLRIQEDIAGAIAEALRGGEGGGASAESLSSGTSDPEAYQLYLQARAMRNLPALGPVSPRPARFRAGTTSARRARHFQKPCPPPTRRCGSSRAMPPRRPRWPTARSTTSGTCPRPSRRSCVPSSSDPTPPSATSGTPTT